MNKQFLNQIDIETLFKCLPKGDYIFQNEKSEWVLVPAFNSNKVHKSGFFNKSLRELIYDYIEYLKDTRIEIYNDTMINLLIYAADECVTQINNFKNQNSNL